MAQGGQIIISKRILNISLLSSFIFIALFFPADIYNFKKILFICLILFNILCIFNMAKKKKNLVITIFGFVFPSVIIIYSFLLTGNIYNSFTRGYAGYLLLLLFIIKYYNIDYEMILVKILKIEVFVILLFVIFDLTNIIDFNNNIFKTFIYKYEIGLMGKSFNYPFYYKLFLKSSPLISILLFKYIEERKYFYVILVASVLLFTGTRANVLFPFFFAILYYFDRKKKTYFKYTLIFILIGCLLIFSVQLYGIFYELIVDRGAVSDAVRIGHVKGLIELYRENPVLLITGSGLGSNFYSYGRNMLVDTIELSYLDLYRQIGFFLFFCFMGFIFIPLLENKYKYKKYMYVSYLLIAGTNPLLYSSTAYIVYIYLYLNKNTKIVKGN